MNELEKAQRRLDLITDGIAAVKFAAEEERKITHNKHIDADYMAALNCLAGKLTGARAYAYRIQVLGK